MVMFCDCFCYSYFHIFIYICSLKKSFNKLLEYLKVLRAIICYHQMVNHHQPNFIIVTALHMEPGVSNSKA